MTGSVEVSPTLTIDVVKARIFYLASDVESFSPPAAMLLRAVADAIEDTAPIVVAAREPEPPPFAGFEGASNLHQLRPSRPRAAQGIGERVGLAGTRTGNRR